MDHAAEVPTIDCVAVAKGLSKLVRDNATETERQRHITDAVVDALHDSGLFWINIPTRFGGHWAAPRQQMEAIEAIAQADGAAGWCFMIQTGWNWQVAQCFPDRALKEIFADKRANVVGAFLPSCFATPVPGGYRVSGQSKFNSNSYRSGWKIMNAVIMDEKGASVDIAKGDVPNMRLMAVPPDQCKILDTWYTAGLRGTASNDVLFEDVFVPDYRTVPFDQALAQKNVPERIHRMPWVPWLGVHITAVTVGIAQAALEHFLDKTRSKLMLTNKMQSQTAFPSTQFAAADAAADIRAARAYLHRTSDEAWERAKADQDPLGETARCDMQMAALFAGSAGVRAVERLFTSGGGAMNFESDPMQRFLRDALATRQHLAASPDRSRSVVGRILCGIPAPSHNPYD